MTRFMVLIFTSLLAILSCRFNDTSNSKLQGTPNMDQLINSSKMATELAEVYIRNIYGEKASKSQKPYNVTDGTSEWIVEGKPPSALGGNFKIILSKKDGQVLKITHSK